MNYLWQLQHFPFGHALIYSCILLLFGLDSMIQDAFICIHCLSCSEISMNYAFSTLPSFPCKMQVMNISVIFYRAQHPERATSWWSPQLPFKTTSHAACCIQVSPFLTLCWDAKEKRPEVHEQEEEWKKGVCRDEIGRKRENMCLILLRLL